MEAHTWGKGRERGIQRTPSRVHIVSTKPYAGLDPRNREIITWAGQESDAQPSDQPGVTEALFGLNIDLSVIHIYDKIRWYCLYIFVKI